MFDSEDTNLNLLVNFSCSVAATLRWHNIVTMALQDFGTIYKLVQRKKVQDALHMCYLVPRVLQYVLIGLYVSCPCVCVVDAV